MPGRKRLFPRSVVTGSSRSDVKRHARAASFEGMRLLAALAVLIPAVVSADDQKTMERIVKTHVAQLAKQAKDADLLVAKDATATVYGKDVKGNISDARTGAAGTIATTLGATAIGVDSEHGVAWFQAQYNVDVTPKGMVMGDPSLFHTIERAGGIVVLGKDGWQIAAAQYGRLIDDDKLAELGKAHGDAVPTGNPKLTGDKGLDGVVNTWLKTGFATHEATDVALVASGTSTKEWATEKDAIALAKTWDALKLKATVIDARTFADGALGYARARVVMPTKSGAVEMALAVVAVFQDNQWRWASLQFSGTHF